MEDGRAHMKYKAENVIDLETELIVVAEIYHGDRGDTSTIQDSVNTAQLHLNQARTGCQIEQVVADKGHHSEDSLDRLQNEAGKRTYIPEPKRKTNRTWKGKPQQVPSEFVETGATRVAHGDENFSACEVNGSIARLPTCVILVVHGTRGFAVWKKSTSVFCQQ